MRKIIVSEMITLDGYFEGPNHEIDWHNVDAEFNEYAIELLNSVDLLLFGRVTYQLMVSYWPTPSAIKDDPIVAEKMNSLPKIVFSKTLEKAEWKNTRLIKDNAAEEIRKIKQQPGKDIALFGSANMLSSLIFSDLIDEYRIVINPIALGDGKSLFRGIKEKLNLKLLEARAFKSGNVVLYYQPVKGKHLH